MEPYTLNESTKHIKPTIVKRITLKDRRSNFNDLRKNSEINSGNTHIPNDKKEAKKGNQQRNFI
jgi:hypothetical protein